MNDAWFKDAPENNAGTSDVETRVARLARTFKECSQSRAKDAFNRYAAEVGDFYRDLKREKAAKKTTTKIAKRANVKNYERLHSIRRLIAATGNLNARAASRMTSALRYAYVRRWTDIERELKANGGIAGCARKFAMRKKRAGKSK